MAKRKTRRLSPPETDKKLISIRLTNEEMATLREAAIAFGVDYLSHMGKAIIQGFLKEYKTNKKG